MNPDIYKKVCNQFQLSERLFIVRIQTEDLCLHYDFKLTLLNVLVMSQAIQPSSKIDFISDQAGQNSPFIIQLRISFKSSILGTSQTLNTFSRFTNPNPVNVAYKLLIACLISPSDVNINASNPSFVQVILSYLQSPTLFLLSHSHPTD
ncbi:unnamed protein product (macronuclear) [Paramecium tetraurelia]|uniref:Uncharacterized protein n=1 Tax=Paramecium tetraurelia TaxID=5888 RepID=A0EAG0_PARTE|nr:uncharacterized protein GSPATT00025009001 [Paramecium tetraurelia]CAK92277.1 unnamed protein product [Paramecium tetraurelia]|eukprot:XP_001459674.1 hypothetical protein (macronuclear) [Paramecium tetraurelia strain d4-2]